ncbi:MAG TPA: hypothetical protein VLG10_16735 [Methylomirabilota bacterium]|nr:hypothetical protein [Methylomirabilota bacterium]
MKSPALRTRRWTRREYEQLVEGGFLGSGDQVEISPLAAPHASLAVADLLP